MKKIKNLFLLEEKDKISFGPYSSGLVVELEDGTYLSHHSTDVVRPYSEITDSIIINNIKQQTETK